MIDGKLTLKEARDWLTERGFERSEVWYRSMIAHKRIKFQKVIGRIVFDEADLEKILKKKPSLKVVVSSVLVFLCLQAAAFAVPDYDRLADAIYKAEGGKKASVPYGIMFKGCDWKNEAYCRKICINTLRNNYKRFLNSDQSIPYLEFLRNRYAPLSHHSLNQNWLKNVQFFYE